MALKKEDLDIETTKDENLVTIGQNLGIVRRMESMAEFRERLKVHVGYEPNQTTIDSLTRSVDKVIRTQVAWTSDVSMDGMRKRLAAHWLYGERPLRFFPRVKWLLRMAWTLWRGPLETR